MKVMVMVMKGLHHFQHCHHHVQRPGGQPELVLAAWISASSPEIHAHLLLRPCNLGEAVWICDVIEGMDNLRAVMALLAATRVNNAARSQQLP